MLAYMFPGQGAQFRGMGAGLFDEVEEFLQVESQLDERIGCSVRTLCLEDPAGRLKETRYTQPALFVVNALYWYAARGRDAEPEFLLGHSLGEYNALLAAGVFDLRDGFEIVRKRGELMGNARGGGMAAVVGLHETRVESILQSEGLSALDIASYNAPAQLVLSGPVDDIRRAEQPFKAAGAGMFIELPVSAAFHSRYMNVPAKLFAEFLADVELLPPRRNVVSNVTGLSYPPRANAEVIRELLVEQITRPVQWMDSVLGLVQRGVTDFRELGPGNVLTRLGAHIQTP